MSINNFFYKSFKYFTRKSQQRDFVVVAGVVHRRLQQSWSSHSVTLNVNFSISTFIIIPSNIR